MGSELHRVKRDTRQEIINKAQELFARNGYAGTRLDDVAKAVGVRRPSLFHHFKDKQTLYREVWNSAIAEQEAFLAPYFQRSDVTASELLDIAVEAWVDYAFDHPDFVYMSLFASASGRAREYPRGTSVGTLKLWQRLLNKGVEEGVFNPVPLADCMALVGGMTMMYTTLPDSPLPILARSGARDKNRFGQQLKRLMQTLLLK